ncbi:hypothetical protein [Sphingobacterium anhuiense]|uniref:hypothetical protein n=1 Tax=Sphingobacterium anhuiense TaxID=493780 RepID=UPI003C2F3C42
MAINLKLQNAILSILEDGLKINELASIDGFAKELQLLENEGKVECNGKPSPEESIYENYRITDFGRRFLN